MQVFPAVSHSGCARKTWGRPLSVPVLLQCVRSGGGGREREKREERRGEEDDSAAQHSGWPGTYPPLLVLLSGDYDHLSLHEGQFVVVVSLAVVDGLHSAGLALALNSRPIQILSPQLVSLF